MKSLTIACALALGLGVALAAPPVLAHPAAPAASAPAAPQLQATMRSLLHGHIVATRDYALAVHAGNQAKAEQAANDAVANAKQIAGAVGSFYGKAAGDQFLKLLAGHWGGVKNLTDSMQAGNKAGEQQAMQDLASNGSDIAKFLAGANPNLPEQTVHGLWMMHVSDHKTQLEQMMANAPAAEQNQTWEHMQEHANTIADALAGAIAKQFPDKAH